MIYRMRRGLDAGLQVRLGNVQPDAAEIVTSIKGLQPYSVSWSNVPDYLKPADFHKLARTISAAETLHFMHSINWIATVKGASHIDYVLGRDKKEVKEVMPKLFNIGQAGIKRVYQSYGLEAALLWPVVDNPRNVIDLACFNAQCRVWVKAFFAPALSGIKDLEKQVQIVEPPVFSVLAGGNSTMHLTFSYKADINLQGVCDD